MYFFKMPAIFILVCVALRYFTPYIFLAAHKDTLMLFWWLVLNQE